MQKIIWAIRHLETSYNPEEKKVIEEALEKVNNFNAGRDIICLTMQSISTSNDEDELQTFWDAWDYLDTNERIKWQAAIKKEFHGMNNRKVWRQNPWYVLPSISAVLKANGFYDKKTWISQGKIGGFWL